MNYFNLLLAVLCLFFWVGVYMFYFKDKLRDWIINRFTRDSFPKDARIKDGYCSDGEPIPFRESIYPSDEPESANPASSKGETGKATDHPVDEHSSDDHAATHHAPDGQASGNKPPETGQ